VWEKVREWVDGIGRELGNGIVLWKRMGKEGVVGEVSGDRGTDANKHLRRFAG
jgi:hypothetical protein